VEGFEQDASDAVVSKPFLLKDLQLAVETTASRALVRSTP